MEPKDLDNHCRDVYTHLKPQTITYENTAGTRVGPGFHDQTLAVKSRVETENFLFVKKNITKKIFFLNISSSYAKISGETNFQPREFPRRGSKAKDREKKKEERYSRDVTERWSQKK